MSCPSKIGESSRGNKLRASEREVCIWEGLWEDLWKRLKNLWKPLKTLRTSENPPSQRNKQGKSRRKRRGRTKQNKEIQKKKESRARVVETPNTASALSAIALLLPKGYREARVWAKHNMLFVSNQCGLALPLWLAFITSHSAVLARQLLMLSHDYLL